MGRCCIGAAARFFRLIASVGRVAEYVSGAVIDVEVAVAEEADESDVEVFCDLHGEARWSTDAGDHRDSTHEGFLEEFEAGTSGEQKQCMAQGSAVCEKLCSEQFVDRVMTSYIFFDAEKFALGGKEAGTVNPACLVKEALGFS